jgi:CubicO group peptidase (beta-lactamase class C family)
MILFLQCRKVRQMSERDDVMNTEATGASRLDPRRISKDVDGAIERALTEQRLVGTVVLIAQDGKLLYHRAAGLADREERRSMSEDTIFRYSSLTKPIVSATAMALLERGQLDLDAPVTRWIPEFRPKTPQGTEAAITIRQLLTHTAGLTYGMNQPPDGPYHRAGVSDGIAEPGLSIEEQLRRLASVPLAYVPGERWGYSLALDVLGEVIARAGGAPLPALIERFITGPLRMSDTAFVVRDRKRLAGAYVDGPPPRPMKDPDVVPFGEGSGIRYSPSRIFNEKSYPSGGAGMAGTAPDFLTFLEAIRSGGGGVLTGDSTRAMMSNQIGALRIDVEPTPSWGFGFGGAVLVDRQLAGVPQGVGTWKWGGVYGHHWFVDPVNRLTVVALTNTAVEGLFGRFVPDLMAGVYGVAPRS